MGHIGRKLGNLASQFSGRARTGNRKFFLVGNFRKILA
jgi:hypothetical protein